MMRKIFLCVACFVFAFLLMTACGKITDFYSAIIKYGYKSPEPLGPKKVKVDKTLFSGYENDGKPVIISGLDNYTYQLNFLSVELEGKDELVEAHASIINGETYLNLKLSSEYAFLKIEKISESTMKVKLLRNTIDPYVRDRGLKSWLVKHGSEDQYVNADGVEIDIWSSFYFKIVTPEEAYQTRDEELTRKKNNLFKFCSSYNTYLELEMEYPGDSMLMAARENLYKRCHSLNDYQMFIQHFPDSEFTEKARQKVQEIKAYKNDSTLYCRAREADQIAAYLQFSEVCVTPAFKDSAMLRIRLVADGISNEQIEWTWTSNKQREAIQFIFDKIAYAENLEDLSWYQQNLTSYAIIISDKDVFEEGLLHLDKLFKKNPDPDVILDMYISKGLILWALGRTEQAVEVFRVKKGEKFSGSGMTFGEVLGDRYHFLHNRGISFPNEKKTWKIIRKAVK